MVKQRICRLEVENFKSLVDFKMDLPKFSCLIGLNGAGKSTVLQFIDFLSQLVRGDMKGWLAERKWKSTDLKSKLTKKKTIKVTVRFANNEETNSATWEATYNPFENRCTGERIVLPSMIFEVAADELKIDYPGTEKQPYRGKINFKYEGSILSAVKEDWLREQDEQIVECKKSLVSIKSLDLLSPEFLRQRVREAAGSLGRGGQNLSAFVYEMSGQKRDGLMQDLVKAYPRLLDLNARSLRSGWKQIEIKEKYGGSEDGFFSTMTTEARHVNDGMLRLTAILAELQSDFGFLLFDEIENGINPEVVEFIIDRLVNAKQQVLVTTHSPMILNYLEDDVARNGVIYLYKTAKGFTESIPFFSIPSLQKKLEVMGPGEAFVDTNLTELAYEIAGLEKEGT